VTTETHSEHLASVAWQRGSWADFPGKYSREHLWHFSSGAKLKASDSTFLMPEGYRDKAKLDPEKLYVATIASSHMLTWLEIAFGMEIDVASYVDSAHGTMSELNDGIYWVSEVILHPKITYGPRRTATAAAEARLHEMAHEQCFIEQSIKTKVTIRVAGAN
jgi:organic hydroperoxide reductase OsmC/OhrA